jgi:tetratricopeptide (TPR) repeat protein
MAIEGPLRELGLHDVFQLLDLSRKTGVMKVTSHLRNNEGLVAFDGGAIVYAEIRSNPFRLGDLLQRAGKVTEADLERARAAQEKEHGSRRLGQILVAMGALSQRELVRQVEFQVTEVVFELLSWQEGFFSFTEGPLSGVPADLLVRIRTESVLMEGARRIDEWSRIESVVPHVGVVPVLTPGDGAGEPAMMDLLPGEWEALALVDGERSVREIAKELARSEFEVARMVFGLVTTGVLLLVDPGVERRPRPSAVGDVGALVAAAELRLEHGDTAAAREAAQAAASVSPGEARVHLVLARAALKDGKTAEAVEEARRAVRLDPLSRDAHRWYGLALSAAGRFAEAEEQFVQWDRLADPSVGAADREAVAAARAAAHTLAQLLGGARG